MGIIVGCGKVPKVQTIMKSKELEQYQKNQRAKGIDCYCFLCYTKKGYCASCFAQAWREEILTASPKKHDKKLLERLEKVMYGLDYEPTNTQKTSKKLEN